ncbi:VWA domain-containing protein [bacterium]|nr:MAG: VWA domain-containing protein [bacterium]
MNNDFDDERLKRWRLVLGGKKADGIGMSLSDADQNIDNVLASLYGDNDGNGIGKDANSRKGGLGNSSPKIARWLGDIRTYFPKSVVQVMQKDALERLNLKQMLLEPEMLENLEADVNLVAQLVALSDIMPEKTKSTARMVIKKVLDELERKLATPTRQAIQGSLNRSVRNIRPKHNEINWNLTIQKNLRHYQKDYQTIIPEKLVGYGRKQSALREIILCIDQSGSMANSVVYSSIFAAVMASIKAVSTKMVVFDTSIVDLSDKLSDPVEVLFGIQLGGGTDINQALAYCQSLITRPAETILVLISDLIEGGSQEQMLKRAGSIVSSGVNFITLLSLSDEGAPYFDHNMATNYANLGITTFACTPELFPDLMASAINKQDISSWASKNNIVTNHAKN